MFRSGFSSFRRGRSDSSFNRPLVNRSVSTGLRRWTRALYITLPILLIFNYLFVFHFSLFERLSRAIFPDRSFHPLPFPPNLHEPIKHGDKHSGSNYWTWKTKTQFKTVNDTGTAGGSNSDPCASFPTHLLSKIQVVLKVGAADHWTRTASQVNAIIKCIDNALVVSDRDHPYGVEGIFNATDVLALLDPAKYLSEHDLGTYQSQKNASLKDLRQGGDGWRLDKYKFLPAIEYAVEQNSGADWYVFIESDTYVFWDNLFRLLEHYDEAMPYYFGSPSPGKKDEDGNQIWFAYGGAGYVLSSPAAQRLVMRQKNSLGVKGPRVTEEYKDDIIADCCGDSMLGWALHDKAGVDVSGLWPMFNPMALDLMPFGKSYWCEPVLTLHKSHAEDLLALWEWENSRDRSQGPLLYRDLLTYHPFFNSNTDANVTLPSLHIIEDWNNDQDGGRFHERDKDHISNQSFESCAAYCQSQNECWQFTWHGHRCYMSKNLHLGEKKDPYEKFEGEDRRFISGWDVEKIKRLYEETTCDEGAHWVKPSIERIY